MRRNQNSFNVWPGYVDVLSALLMVVIFVLLIFTVAQFLLSEILSGQESELSQLHRQINEITELLGLEQKKTKQFSVEIISLSEQVTSLTGEKSRLDQLVDKITNEAENTEVELRDQLMTVISLQEDISTLRQIRDELEKKAGELASVLASKTNELGEVRDRSKVLEARLSDQRDRTFLVQKESEDKEIRIQALTALIGNQKQALEEEKSLSASVRSEVVLLNQNIRNLKVKLEEISRALDTAEMEKQSQAVVIEDLGKKLNLALARRVNRLEQYRSEFFGRLKQVLGENPFVSIEGDRFIFQAELLFGSGSATLEPDGKIQLGQLSDILRELSKKIPEDINWILRIDGHTDQIPINNERFASNWELSTARSLSVVRFLSEKGIPENRMAAAGFSKYHPLDPAQTEDAFRKNRRIEIKLTSR